MKRLFESAVILLLIATPVLAQPSGLVVTDGWFRSLPGKLPAGGYFNARSNSGAPIVITGAEAPGCASLMLHRSSDKGGMSHMEMVDKVTVPPGGTLSFAPGGYHLMCMNPSLKIGTRVPVDLHLADGSKVVAAFDVRGATGK
ncbi:MAG: copper chaperone PCu(A)C [Alphaproteobacteria bacterium]|nr:copper chaperone PCu(A)C [Alphaproteobacteria bacterium]